MFASPHKKICNICHTLNSIESVFVETKEDTQYLILLSPIFTTATKYAKSVRLSNSILMEDPNKILIKSVNGQIVSFKLKSLINEE